MFEEVHLQRYLTGKKLIQFLNDGGLYLRRIDGFEDKSEGNRAYYEDKEKNILNGINNKLEKMNMYKQVSHEEGEEIAKSMMDTEKLFFFIQSWYKNSTMSKDMWIEYAGYKKSNNCALLVVDYMCLSNQLHLNFPIGCSFKKVSYVPDKSLSRDAINAKNIEFIKEKEVRLSIDLREIGIFNPEVIKILNYPNSVYEGFLHQYQTQSDLRNYYNNEGRVSEGLFESRDDKGFILKLNLENFAVGILIPSTATSEFKEEIQNLLDINDFSIPLMEVNVEELCKEPDL